MNTKMKGLFKGLRYISSIFDPEDQEKEIEIGFPTDVKHVSHIGCDGSNVDSGPSWMKEFKSTEEISESSLSNIRDTRENSEIILAPQDLQRKSSKAKDSSSREQLSKSSRRHKKELSENTSGISSPRKEKRNSRRRSTKEQSSENSNSSRQFLIEELETTKDSRRRSTTTNSNSNRHLQIQDGIDSPTRHSTSKKSKELDIIDSGLIRPSTSKAKRSGVDENLESPSITNEYSARSRSKELIQVSRVN